MNIQDIKNSVTEPDLYRREAAIKRAISDWAISKLPPCDADKHRTITGVDYDTGEATFVDRPTAEIEAERAASEEARRATPIVYDQPIETPMVSLLSCDSCKGVGLVATDDGTLATLIVHESPWPDKTALKAKIAAAVAKSKGIHAKGKAGINGQLQARIENIERALGWRL